MHQWKPTLEHKTSFEGIVGKINICFKIFIIIYVYLNFYIVIICFVILQLQQLHGTE